MGIESFSVLSSSISPFAQGEVQPSNFEIVLLNMELEIFHCIMCPTVSVLIVIFRVLIISFPFMIFIIFIDHFAVKLQIFQNIELKLFAITMQTMENFFFSSIYFFFHVLLLLKRIVK